MFLFLLSIICPLDLDQVRKEFPIVEQDEAIVEDATNRFAPLEDREAALRHVLPIVVRLQDRRCVVFRFRAAVVGDPMIYCYARDQDTFLELFVKSFE